MYDIDEKLIRAIREKSDVTEGGCMLWKGHVRASGGPVYGKQKVSLRKQVYRMYAGEEPRTHCIRPICGNDACVAFDHIWAGEVPWELLMAFRSREEPDGCIVWTGQLSTKEGLPVVTRMLSGRKTESRYAHRVAWELSNGPLGKHEALERRCGCRSCVNPRHYDIRPTGAYRPVRMSTERVSRILIMREQGVSQREIAKSLGISKGAVEYVDKRSKANASS